MDVVSIGRGFRKWWFVAVVFTVLSAMVTYQYTTFVFDKKPKTLQGIISGVKTVVNTSNTSHFEYTREFQDDLASPSIQKYLEYQSSKAADKEDVVPKNCSFRFGSTPAEDLAKIDSYKFEGIQKYMEELFPPMLKEPVPPQLPVFVSAFSSNHYKEGLAMIRNLNKTVRQKYRDIRFIIYDIGLSSDQIQSLKALCACEVRTLHFEKFPKHLKNLKNYAWKPVVIQTVAKEHSLVVWMDASVRFKTCHLDELFMQAKRHGLMVRNGGIRLTGTISERTYNATFNFLQEHPCTFANQAENGGGFLLVAANQFITKYFLRPWVSCALALGCMAPVLNSRATHCNKAKIPYTFHLCHRFDQSVLGILNRRLFHRHQKENIINNKYVVIERSPSDTKSDCTLNNQ